MGKHHLFAPAYKSALSNALASLLKHRTADDRRLAFPTITTACRACGTEPWTNGARPAAGAPLPYNESDSRCVPPIGGTPVMVWCPKIDTLGDGLAGESTPWVNMVLDDGQTILERRTPEKKNKEHIANMHRLEPLRITFLKSVDHNHTNGYVFMGVYYLDSDNSSDCCVWRRLDESEYQF